MTSRWLSPLVIYNLTTILFLHKLKMCKKVDVNVPNVFPDSFYKHEWLHIHISNRCVIGWIHAESLQKHWSQKTNYLVNLTKVSSVLAKDEESSHHMAKDAHKKCVFTALLIFWANCVSSPHLLVPRQTKCGQTLIYLTAFHFVFPIIVGPCYCGAGSRWHRH